MNTNSRTRSGRVLIVCVVLLLASSGLAAGYFLSPSDSIVSVDERPDPSPAIKALDEVAVVSGATHRFTLSAEDVHDQHQAPQVVSTGQNTVWVAWDSRMPDQTNALLLCRSDDGGVTFEQPQLVRRVAVEEREVVMRGNRVKRASRLWPRLGWANETLSLAWLQPDMDDPAQFDLLVSSSSNRGATFEQARPLSTPDAVRPGFTGFCVDDRGSVAAAWLDGRNGSQQLFASVLSGGQADERLVFAGPDGNGICPCCNVAITIADDRTQYVAFRNHRDGYRDIWLSVQAPDGEAFGPPQRIVEDRWVLDGCPHDGPSMVLHAGRLHLVWMDAHNGIQRVYHADATPDGRQFTVRPITPDSGGAQGHPFLHSSDDGKLHVVWDQALDGSGAVGEGEPHQHEQPMAGRAVYHSVSSDNGTTFSRMRAVNPVAGAFQTRPTIAGAADGALVVAWCELSERGKEIVVHHLPSETAQ